jgi:hypothetical protein
MSLTQIQIIQSLGEAMSWLERELSWGTPIQELRHLTGRIGELYVALITNGRMATEVNQKGFDVTSESGERISVKTRTEVRDSYFVDFNYKTLEFVDRVIILRINTQEMEIETLLDEPIEEAKKLMTVKLNKQGKVNIPMSKLLRHSDDLSKIPVLNSVLYKTLTIQEHENGSIQVLEKETSLTPTRPILQEIAKELGVPILNQNNVPLNTRQLGGILIKTLKSK